MTPQERQMLYELHNWMQQRKIQQLDFPLDDPSKNLIGVLIDEGRGATALTQAYNVTGGGGGSITGPKAYSDTEILFLPGGVRIEVPVLSYPS